MKTIVILGSSFGGVSTAHRLLKQAAKTGDVKVILVGPTTHFFWNFAGPRAIIPGQFADDKLFGAIVPGFKQYTADRFEFLLGTAERLNLESNNVVVATGSGEKVVGYDILILATGSSTKGDVPFKSRGTYEATRDALHDFQSRVKKAHSIVVGGAGATGVETAAELGFEYGSQKKITLVRIHNPRAVLAPSSPTSCQLIANGFLRFLAAPRC
jgi:NADH dehydrogenase FAD-containing subunit